MHSGHMQDDTRFNMFVRNKVFAIHCDPFIELQLTSHKKINGTFLFCKKNFQNQKTITHIESCMAAHLKHEHSIRIILKSITGYMCRRYAPIICPYQLIEIYPYFLLSSKTTFLRLSRGGVGHVSFSANIVLSTFKPRD